MSKPKTEKGAALRVVEESEVLQLAREDRIRLAEALDYPPEANARLARAAKRHAELITQE